MPKKTSSPKKKGSPPSKKVVIPKVSWVSLPSKNYSRFVKDIIRYFLENFEKEGDGTNNVHLLKKMEIDKFVENLKIKKYVI